MNLIPINLGLGIVAATHIMMLNTQMPPEVQTNHAYINLAAAGLIAYGVFM